MQASLALLIVLLVSFGTARCFLWAMGKAWFWERAIRRFEEADLQKPPKPGVIVFTGSSSINFWKNLDQDMAPLNVVNRGFGGSQMAHLTHYATRVVLPYFPQAVVVYAGENDLSWPWSKSPESILRDFQEFVHLVQERLPSHLGLLPVNQADPFAMEAVGETATDEPNDPRFLSNEGAGAVPGCQHGDVSSQR